MEGKRRADYRRAGSRVVDTGEKGPVKVTKKSCPGKLIGVYCWGHGR
jgi:hypothetical protein